MSFEINKTQAKLAAALLILFGLASLIFWFTIPPTLVERGPLLLDFLPRYFALFAIYLGAIVVIGRAPAHSRYTPFIIFLFALLFRLPLLSHLPTLSDDVYRYIWDGRLQNAWVNPYQYRVDSPELDYVSTPSRALVNNPSMASPYLPVAQILFASVYRVAPESPTAFQLTALGFDLATGWLIMLLLKRLGQPPERALIYLWNPLIVVEFAHGAHIDSLMGLLMIAALWASQRPQETADARWHWLAGPILLALATLVKPIPALLLPALAPRWGWKGLSLYGAVLIAGLLPYSGAGLGLSDGLTGTGMFGALRIYINEWNFNGGLYHWLELYYTGVHKDGGIPLNTPGMESVRTVATLLMVGILIGVFWRSLRSDSSRLWAIPFAGYLLLAPTLHPWYLAALVAVLPFGEIIALTFLYFTASVAMSYLTYFNPHLHFEPDWLRRWEYLPLYGLLVLSALASFIYHLKRRLTK